MTHGDEAGARPGREGGALRRLAARGGCALGLLLAAGCGAPGGKHGGAGGDGGNAGSGGEGGGAGGAGGGSGGAGGGGGSGGGIGGAGGGGAGADAGMGPSDPSAWALDDAIASGGVLKLTNGDYTFTFEHRTNPMDMRETHLTLKIAAKASAYKMGFDFNKVIGANNDGATFYTFYGKMTGHAVEDAGPDAKRLKFEYAKPDDSGDPSRLLGPLSIVITVRWKNPRLDIDLARPILKDFRNHNGFADFRVDPDGFPFTLRMGMVEKDPRFAMTQKSSTTGEDVIGFFLRDDGTMGSNQSFAPDSTRAHWKDYFVIEQKGRATLVYEPEFRKHAVPKTFDSANYFQNSIRPCFDYVCSIYSQTTDGGTIIWAPVPKGDYDEHARVLLDQPIPSPGDYDGWLDKLR